MYFGGVSCAGDGTMRWKKFRKEAGIEALFALAFGLGLGGFAVHADLYEKVYHFTRDYEAYELDEFLCFLSAILVVFSFLAVRYIFVLRRLTRELRQANEIIRKHNEVQNQKEKLAALGQIASGLAHEISNALQPTIGLGGYIKESLRSQGKVKHSAFMDVMIDSAHHAQQVIDNVMAFAQSKAIILTPHPASEAFQEAISFAAERMSSTIRIEMHGLDSLEDNKGKPLFIACNRTALTQIFLNILKNASMAMSHEGVIRIDCHPSCSLMDGRKARSISLSITDHGCGMDEMTAQKVFDPFFSTKDASEGAGLGLPVVYGLMQQHKGDIGVTSKIGKGTTFTLTFPEYLQEA